MAKTSMGTIMRLRHMAAVAAVGVVVLQVVSVVVQQATTTMSHIILPNLPQQRVPRE